SLSRSVPRAPIRKRCIAASWCATEGGGSWFEGRSANADATQTIRDVLPHVWQSSTGRVAGSTRHPRVRKLQRLGITRDLQTDPPKQRLRAPWYSGCSLGRWSARSFEPRATREI